MKAVFVLLTLVLCQALVAQAPYQDFIGAGHFQDIVVTTSHTEGSATGQNTVNGSGLTGMAHSADPQFGWITLNQSANPVPGRGSSFWISYDLGHAYTLGSSVFWNFNEEGFTEGGVRQVTIDTSADGTTWTEWGSFEVAQASGANGYTGTNGPDFAGLEARYITLTINSFWEEGGDEGGLAEIKINVSPPQTAVAGPSLRVVHTSSNNYLLVARTASDATTSQLQHSWDLTEWYAMLNISGASNQQEVPMVSESRAQFFRLGTKNNAGALPSITTNTLSIYRGQTLPLTSAHLQVSDSDSSPTDLLISVADVVGGQFERVEAPGIAITSFTQADIGVGAIQFVHDGSLSAPAFTVGVSDGGNLVAPRAGTVSFQESPPANTAPSLLTNRLIIGQGQTVPVNSSVLASRDSEQLPSQITYFVSQVSGGRFERVASPGVAVASFTQSDIDAGAVQFSHDGGISAPAYLVSVGDGESTTDPVPANVTFSLQGVGAAPVLVANSQATFIGSNTILSPAHIDAVDYDSAPTLLTYTASEVSGGRFERVSSPGVANTSFTQADIDSRAIRFVQDGSNTPPSYKLALSDGSNVTAPSQASISFCDGTRTSVMTEGEMSSLNNLVRLEQVTHSVVNSGRWSDPSTWQNSSLPTQGARIHIPSGLAVVVDSQLAPEFKSIRIDGMLRFAPHISTRLKVDTMVSYHCARFEVGTAAIPIYQSVTAEVIFADDGPINTTADFAQLGRGAILHGKTVIYGAERTNKVALAVHPRSGASTLELASTPTGWKVGDELIITGTIAGDPRSDEVRRISAINGTQVTLDSALALDHVAPRLDLNVYVANSTRNVVFSSENATIARRGHMMLMHTLEADLNYARFYQMGRTDKTRQLDDVTFNFNEDAVGNSGSAPIAFTTISGARTNIRGRYPIHFHRGGTDPSFSPGIVNGCVVQDSPGWGFVMHSAHCRFLNNVSYAIQGTGYYTEAGDEVGEMVNNIAIRTVNSAFVFDSAGGAIDPDLGFEQQEFGNDGDGYWLSGNLVAMRNNVSAGSTAHGIIFWSDGLVEADIPRGRATVKTSEIANGNLIPGRATIPTWWAPLAEVSGNECYGSSVGFRARYIHAQTYLGEGGSPFHASPPQAYIDTLDPVIDRLTVWGNRDGVLLNYCHRMSVKNSLIVGIGAPYRASGGTADTGVGLDKANEVSRGSGRIENVTIEGFEMGFITPRNDQWTFSNLLLRNVTDMLINEPRQGPRTITMENVTFGDLSGTAVAGRGGRRNIVMAASFEALGYQPFWFVMPDRITLDGEGIYYDQQASSFTPLQQALNPDELIIPVPSSYFNRTNQQLFNTFGVSFGGAFLPANARTDSRVVGGVMGTPAPAATVFHTLLDMTGEGGAPEDPKGGPTPELTNNRLEIARGKTVTLMETNLNTTDTNTGIASLTYSVSGVTNGYFAHRDAPDTPITSFTQAQVNGGVIRFKHDGSSSAPSYFATVTDGSSSSGPVSARVKFR